jgi:hypothetical protein
MLEYFLVLPTAKTIAKFDCVNLRMVYQIRIWLDDESTRVSWSSRGHNLFAPSTPLP